MRKLIELHEEIDEVNLFLREWQRLKSGSNSPSKLLIEPEIRFISRTLERLIVDAQSLDVPLVLRVDRKTHQKQHFTEEDVRHKNVSTIQLTECLKLVNTIGKTVSYIGNSNGLLSINRIAEMVAGGSELKLLGSEFGDF